ALTFGTLLSSQGTEASFETVSPAPPGFPFVVSNLTRSVSRFRSSFPAPYWSGVFRFAPSGVSTTLADFPGGS
ncbi:hypothetical protein PV350_44430, partial [Streptomyces sp. PA03-6a]|nr:hypothetical protein [Streptomyces sp. PA03-6a]